MMTDGRNFNSPIKNRAMVGAFLSNPRDALKALPAFTPNCQAGKLMLLITQDRAATHLAQERKGV